MATVATIGSIITDLAVQTPRVPQRGENLLAHRLHISPGGKGANASVAVARLGADSILLGRIGDDDFGHRELAALRAEDVNIDAVSVDSEVQSGVALIMVDDEGENTILVIIGANDRLTPAHVDAGLASHWDRLDAVLVNFEVPESAVRSVVEIAHQRGVPTVVDAGPPRPFGPEVWGRATVLSPNAYEAAGLVGHPIEDDAAAEAAAHELLSQGPQAVVLKRGGKGALVVAEDGVHHVPSLPAIAVDTTGAGDAFSAALTVALAEGRPLLEATRFACAAGAVAVTRVGALPAMPTRDEVQRMLEHGFPTQPGR